MFTKATLRYLLPSGAIMVAEFSFPETAARYVRSEGINTYEIRVGACCYERSWRLA
jgi:hypothetical protein